MNNCSAIQIGLGILLGGVGIIALAIGVAMWRDL